MKQLSGMRKASKAAGDDVTLTRWIKIEGYVSKRNYRTPPAPANATRTRFLKRVIAPGKNVLVSGHSNVKIGRDVRKGHLRGAWIYSLSLEERATCPTSCNHWRDCYGNASPLGRRTDHRDEPALEEAIRADLIRYSRRGRRLLVRLHVLGDFYSPDYVKFWTSMLQEFPSVTIYGYTAHPVDSPIGLEIQRAKDAFGLRFAIRWSGRLGRWGAMDIRKASDAPPDSFICPEQTGKTKACATCALCWSTDKLVAFMDH